MKKLSFFIIGFIVLLIILFNFVGVLRPVKNFFRGLINPGAKQIYEWSLELGDKETFHSIAELETAYIELKIKYFQRVTEFGAAQLLRAENEELRALAAFAERTDFNLVGASVIGKNIDNLRHGLVLDKGKKDGLEAENLVVAGDGVYVGRICKLCSAPLRPKQQTGRDRPWARKKPRSNRWGLWPERPDELNSSK